MDALKSLQSLGLSPNTVCADDKKLLEQANKLWSMLDDLAEQDPQAYQRFIEKQCKEHQESMAPPKPHMCVKTQFQSEKKEVIFLNIVSWSQVPAPKSQDDNVPLFASPLEYIDKDTAQTVAIAANPEVLKEYGLETSVIKRQEFVNIALDYLEHLSGRRVDRNFTLLPQNCLFQGDLSKIQDFFLQSMQKAIKKNALSKEEDTAVPQTLPEGSSLLSQLANISASNKKGTSSSSHKQNIPLPVMLSGTDVGKKSRKNLIQEISGTEKKCTTPEYTLETANEGNTLVLTVTLPGIQSVSDCQLDISEDDVKLLVEGKYDLMVNLPFPIMDNEACAKFSKKQSKLKLLMPIVGSRSEPV